jgi:hypothetical protein
MDHGEEVPAEFFKAGCEPSHVLHGAEETLDDVAHFVETQVMGDRLPGVALRGDDRQGPIVGNQLADRTRAVGLIGDDGKRGFGILEKVGQDLTVMDLAAGDDKAPGTAVLIDYRMNLGCAATS